MNRSVFTFWRNLNSSKNFYIKQKVRPQLIFDTMNKMKHIHWLNFYIITLSKVSDYEMGERLSILRIESVKVVVEGESFYWGSDVRFHSDSKG